MPDIPPPTAVLTFTFLSWTVGTAVGGALTRLDRTVQSGHFKVVWLVSTVLAAAAGFGYTPAWILAAGSLLTFVGIYRRFDLAAGLITAAGGVVTLFTSTSTTGSIAAATGGANTLLVAGVAAASALFLGAVTNAMLLGHWHLNQPKLGTAPLRRVVYALWAGLVVFTAASVAIAIAGTDAAGLGGATAAAFGVFSMVLTAMVTHLVRIRSIMSATGILYLVVLLALVCVFTAGLGALAIAGA